MTATASCTALRSGTSTVSRRYRTRRLASCIRLRSRRAPRLCVKQLHWLPIRQLITYKLATLTFKAKYCRTPLYLHEQLRDHQIARTLRSILPLHCFTDHLCPPSSPLGRSTIVQLKSGTVSKHPQDRPTLSVVLGVA